MNTVAAVVLKDCQHISAAGDPGWLVGVSADEAEIQLPLLKPLHGRILFGQLFCSVFTCLLLVPVF